MGKINGKSIFLTKIFKLSVKFLFSSLFFSFKHLQMRRDFTFQKQFIWKTIFKHIKCLQCVIKSNGLLHVLWFFKFWVKWKVWILIFISSYMAFVFIVISLERFGILCFFTGSTSFSTTRNNNGMVIFFFFFWQSSYLFWFTF